MGMSFSRAKMLLDTIQMAFDKPVLTKGSGNKGTQLTKFGLFLDRVARHPFFLQVLKRVYSFQKIMGSFGVLSTWVKQAMQYQKKTLRWTSRN